MTSTFETGVYFRSLYLGKKKYNLGDSEECYKYLQSLIIEFLEYKESLKIIASLDLITFYASAYLNYKQSLAIFKQGYFVEHINPLIIFNKSLTDTHKLMHNIIFIPFLIILYYLMLDLMI